MFIFLCQKKQNLTYYTVYGIIKLQQIMGVGIMENNKININGNDITSHYVNTLLRRYKIACAGNDEVIDQLAESFKQSGLDENAIERLVRYAKNASIILSKPGNYVSADNLKEVLDRVNIGLIESLSDVYSRFYNALDEQPIAQDLEGNDVYESKGFSRSIRDIVSNIIPKYDKDIIVVNEKTIADMNMLAFIYSELKKYLPKSVYFADTNSVFRYTDEIVEKISSTKFLSHMNDEGQKAIREVCETLTSSGLLGNDSLTPENLNSLLNKTSSILYSSNKEKILALQENIAKYKDYLLGFVGSDKKFIDMINRNIDFKKVIDKSGIVLGTAPETQKANMLLYTGSNLDQAVQNSGVLMADKSKDGLAKFGAMKVSIEPEDLYNMLVTSPSIILSSFTPSKLYDIGNEFDQILTSMFEDNEIDNPSRLNMGQFPLEELVTGKNLKDLMYIVPDRHKFDPNQKHRRDVFIENILTLNTIMDGTQIFKIIQNNVRVLTKDPVILKTDIDNLIKANMSDPSEFDKQVNKYVNQLINQGSSGPVGGFGSITHTGASKKSESIKVDDTFVIKTDYFDAKVDQIDDQVDLDGDDLVKKINDCFQRIYEKFKSINDYFNYVEKSFANNQKPHSGFQVSIVRSHIVSNINQISKLILQLEKVDPKLARGFMQQLNLLKINCNNVSERCEQKMNEFNRNHPKLEYGKEYQKNVGNESLYQYIQRTKKGAKNIQNEEYRNSAMDNILEFERLSKGRIEQEFIDANADRINANKEYMQELPYYSIYAVTMQEMYKIENVLNNQCQSFEIDVHGIN